MNGQIASLSYKTEWDDNGKENADDATYTSTDFHLFFFRQLLVFRCAILTLSIVVVVLFPGGLCSASFVNRFQFLGVDFTERQLALGWSVTVITHSALPVAYIFSLPVAASRRASAEGLFRQSINAVFKVVRELFIFEFIFMLSDVLLDFLNLNNLWVLRRILGVSAVHHGLLALIALWAHHSSRGHHHLARGHLARWHLKLPRLLLILRVLILHRVSLIFVVSWLNLQRSTISVFSLPKVASAEAEIPFQCLGPYSRADSKSHNSLRTTCYKFDSSCSSYLN